MPWVVGIDEAGYGPNLGPLVQAAVAVRLPDHDPAGWDTLKPHVRRCCDPDDGRLLIDDSKKVYAGPGGFSRLELGVLAACVADRRPLDALATFWFLDRAAADLRAEAWYSPDQLLPVHVDPAAVEAAMWTFADAVRPLGGSWAMAANLVPAPRFNRVVDESGSKAAVLARGMVDLMARLVGVGAPCPDLGREPVLFLCDKHGGRHFYAAMLQDAFPAGWVVAARESAAESRYRIANLDRDVEVVFRPRADAESVAVALASMLAKYLREVCMMQFNAFWRTHVPDLEPTAGYPGDAKRFYDAIRPAMEKLGLPADAVWRKR